MKAILQAIEYALPDAVLDNLQLSKQFPDWSPEKIEAKTGIRERRIAGSEEFSSDLAVKAGAKLFAREACERSEVDFLILCTQTPDYFLPSTACLVQNRLGLSCSCGALDVNLGCSGFIYGLGLAKGLIETGQASNVLLITAETYSKLIHPEDKSVRTIFGDGAAATLIEASVLPVGGIGPCVYGTDGRGAPDLIVPAGAMRQPSVADAPTVKDSSGNARTINHLYMDGPKVFDFTLRVVPDTVLKLLSKAGKSLSDIDLFVFHQANRYMLDHLRKKLQIPADRFAMAFSHCGNTVSSTIPIALRETQLSGRIKAGDLIVCVGFGVGYSWGAMLIEWGECEEL
jgi:3-oxoacyl-[acyl-carrier-protein] synthase III